MSADLVSAIIPAYNSEKYVAAALESVLNQTYAPLEVIVVDDGSTDRTLDKIQPFLRRVKLIRQENRGVSRARNRAVREAQGAYLAFLDADDLWRPDKLARQMEFFKKHPQVAVVAAAAREIDAEGRELTRGTKALESDLYDRPLNWHEALLMRGNYITLSAAVVRREAFERVGGFYVKERIRSTDYDLWIRLSANHLFYVASETLADYRILGDSMLHGTLAKEYGAQLGIIELNRASYRPEQYKKRLARLYGDWADSAFYQGDRADGWRQWRKAASLEPFSPHLWSLGLRALVKGALRFP